MKRVFLKYFRAQPRLFTAIAAGLTLEVFLPRGWREVTRLLVAWDCATGLYLLLALEMMARSSVDKIRSRADRQDEGQVAILVLTTFTALASLAAIVAELTTAKSLKGAAEWQHFALAGATVLLSWTFTHAIFAVHYAHEYYARADGDISRGLEFPGDEAPDYWDFVYYAFVIGTACATADVNVASRHMRRITTLHCVVAFFFNTTILALTVNIGSDFF